jgi:hypothetical protein
MVSIAAMLKPLRAVAVDHLEELAARLAAGEAVAPEEVSAILDRLQVDEDELQHAVDRQARVLDLRRQIADADEVEKRLKAIEAAWGKAEAESVKARAAYDALLLKHHEEHMTCRHRMDAIGRARRALVADDNLPPPQAASLRLARRVCDDLADSRAALANELIERRARLRRAEESLPAAEASAKLHTANGSLQADAERLRNAVATRRTLVAEAEESLADVDRRHEKALAERARLEREVMGAALR